MTFCHFKTDYERLKLNANKSEMKNKMIYMPFEVNYSDQGHKKRENNRLYNYFALLAICIPI